MVGELEKRRGRCGKGNQKREGGGVRRRIRKEKGEEWDGELEKGRGRGGKENQRREGGGVDYTEQI